MLLRTLLSRVDAFATHDKEQGKASYARKEARQSMKATNGRQGCDPSAASRRAEQLIDVGYR